MAVVIPIYQSELSESEMASLRQCVKVLGNYPIKVIKPRSLNLDDIKVQFKKIEFIGFDDAYFSDIAGYNRLMTNIDFYRSFPAYKYILIYQLDAFVFRDELAQWCKKGFDYVGAPTLYQSEFNALPAESKDEFAKALSDKRFVLNGGLSLRRVPAMIRYLRIYNSLFFSPWKGNEDMLFSQDATRLIPLKPFLRLPSWKEALNFAFEKSPAATFELTGKQLPFGCHAWEKYDPEFWSSFISVK